MSQRAGHMLRIDPRDVKSRTSLIALIGQDVALKKRHQDFWARCPFHAEMTPSFKVDQSDRFFKCFGCDAHGDAFDYLRLAHGMKFREAVEYLAIEAGIIPDREGVKRPEVKPAKRPAPGTLSAAETEKQARALSIWGAAVPAAGTLVETYLRDRAITIPIPTALKYDPGTPHDLTNLVLPAMVAAVQGPTRHVVAIHRTYLRLDGCGQAGGLNETKLGLGPYGAGAVRLARAGSVLGLAEGIETALSARQIFDLPTWAALGSRLASVELPPEVREVQLFGDNGDRGHRAAEKAAEAFTAQGRRVFLRFPRERFGDFNDVLRAEVAA